MSSLGGFAHWIDSECMFILTVYGPINDAAFLLTSSSLARRDDADPRYVLGEFIYLSLATA